MYILKAYGMEFLGQTEDEVIDTLVEYEYWSGMERDEWINLDEANIEFVER